MKNALNSTHWNMADDIVANDFYAEEHEAELSAESFSWETDPMTLLEDLEEWDHDENDFSDLF